jgi:hypothetical protein
VGTGGPAQRARRGTAGRAGGGGGGHGDALAADAPDAAGARRAHAGSRARAHAQRQGEKDATLARKLAQFQPFIAVFPPECMGQLASFGPT